VDADGAQGNREKAAEILSVSERALYGKTKEYNL
jgi:DNA-binding NtrC family response regulator